MVVNVIKNQLFDRSPLGMMFREIRTKILYDFNVCTSSHYPRACNEVAHTLAAMGL